MQGKPPLHNYFAILGPRTGCKRLEFVIFFDIFDIFDIAKLAKKSLNVEMSMIPPLTILNGANRLKFNPAIMMLSLMKYRASIYFVPIA